MLWQLKDRLSPTLKTSSSGESQRTGERPRPFAVPSCLFLPLCLSLWFDSRRSSDSKSRISVFVKHCRVKQGSVLLWWWWGLGVGGSQRWVRQILCTTKARSLLVWRMADSPGCVDKLLITTNGNIIHLSLINSYFWETNKQKVICPQQDDIHSSAVTSWHLGSWSLISTKGCGYDAPTCVPVLVFSCHSGFSVQSKDVAVTLKLFVGASELVGPVMNWWLCPGCTPTATHLAQARASCAQQVVMGKWMGGSVSWRCCNFLE